MVYVPLPAARVGVSMDHQARICREECCYRAREERSIVRWVYVLFAIESAAGDVGDLIWSRNECGRARWRLGKMGNELAESQMRSRFC